jgi:steroid 5-alpha reductase family enzyme
VWIDATLFNARVSYRRGTFGVFVVQKRSEYKAYHQTTNRFFPGPKK